MTSKTFSDYCFVAFCSPYLCTLLCPHLIRKSIINLYMNNLITNLKPSHIFAEVEIITQERCQSDAGVCVDVSRKHYKTRFRMWTCMEMCKGHMIWIPHAHLNVV